jgi:aminopeptidase-like protein
MRSGRVGTGRPDRGWRDSGGTGPRRLCIPARADLGDTLTSMIERMFPICRSITGDGVRDTLAIVAEQIDLEVHEVPSGTSVLDWTVPPEWNIRDAFIADRTGARVVDFRESNLHVVSYSTPIDRWMTLDELRPHLHSLPDQPALVPYRTSYYTEAWGFCLADDRLRSLAEGEYHVVIDSTLAPGSLTYGEFVVEGELAEEVLLSTHLCHPSLCDDNLTGIAVATALAAALAAGPRPRHTHRFLFAPGTIGAITWLARNRDRVDRIVAGLTLTCLGDDHPFTYKRTERTGTLTDRAVEYVLGAADADHEVIDFFPYGYDERQYNSPGFRIPVGSLMRGRHGRFPEYHTSADDLSFISAERLVESFSVLARVLEAVDGDRTMRNLEPYAEPQLGSRGLYHALGGTDIADAQLAMLWVLNQSDGATSLLDIAERSGIGFASIAETARVLEAHGLLADAAGSVDASLEDRA